MTSVGQYVSRRSSRPFADGRHFAASERIDDGKHFTTPIGGKHQQCVGVSQRFRGKHFTALAGEASTLMSAFHSAFAGSISQRRCRREASAHAGVSQRFRGKHFAASLWTGSISACWEECVCFGFVFVFVFVLCLCFVLVFVLVMQVGF